MDIKEFIGTLDGFSLKKQIIETIALLKITTKLCPLVTKGDFRFIQYARKRCTLASLVTFKYAHELSFPEIETPVSQVPYVLDKTLYRHKDGTAFKQDLCLFRKIVWFQNPNTMPMSFYISGLITKKGLQVYKFYKPVVCSLKSTNVVEISSNLIKFIEKLKDNYG